MKRFKTLIRKYRVPAACSVFGLLLGGAIGYGIFFYATPTTSAFTEVRANSPLMHYANPLLFYKSMPDSKYDDLKGTVQDYIEKSVHEGNAKNVSVYVRDMNTGEWAGINENDVYEPASMLKVAVMMAYLKREEAKPTLLSEQTYYTPTARTGEYYPAHDKEPAGNYSIDTLLSWMIMYSDNDALTSLQKYDTGETASLFTLFQLPTAPTSTEATSSDFMSARSYSRIFRTLYDGTYLSWNLSENALHLLSLTDFKQGLVAGVPEGTVVAHKFGERTARDAGTDAVLYRELHDCGIIYKPGKPYFLCVMTRGDDFPKLQTIISDISNTVYTNIDGVK